MRTAAMWTALAAMLLTTPAEASEPLMLMPAAQFETMFLMSMPNHHLMAVEMSRICLDKPVSSNLRAMCQQIQSSQQNEIRIMHTWLENWYGVQYLPMLTNADRRELERMRAMDATQFQMEYLKMMVMHHWQATTRTGACIDRGHDLHDDLEALCEKMTEDQVDEIKTMRAWLCQWFGECNVRADGQRSPMQ